APAGRCFAPSPLNQGARDRKLKEAARKVLAGSSFCSSPNLRLWETVRLYTREFARASAPGNWVRTEKLVFGLVPAPNPRTCGTDGQCSNADHCGVIAKLDVEHRSARAWNIDGRIQKA